MKQVHLERNGSQQVKPKTYWGGYRNHRIIEYTDGTCEYQIATNGNWIPEESGPVNEIIGKHIGWINGSTGMHTYRSLL